MNTASRAFRQIKIVCILLAIALQSDGQEYFEPDTINFYRLTVGIGAGKGYPQQTKNAALAVTMELAYQRKKQLFSLGMHSVSDGKSSEDKSEVSNSVTEAFLTYGRAYTKRRFYSSFNAGVGFIFTEEKGKRLCECIDRYEKVKGSAIGLSMSLKILKIGTYAGKGLDIFLNTNKRNSFGGVNCCFQLGKLKKEERTSYSKDAYNLI